MKTTYVSLTQRVKQQAKREELRARRDAKTPRMDVLFINLEAFCRTTIEALAVTLNGEYDSDTTRAAHDRMQAFLGGCDLPH